LHKGFTLVELIIVIIIVGILASIGLTQYSKVVEKSRAAEARMILGTLRSAQIANYFDVGSYVAVASLGVGAPESCTSTHFFTYACTTDGKCTATRCTANGKPTQGSSQWTKALDINGSWSGAAGY